jgi:hypothetical protein
MNLAKLPIELASMQYSGAGGASESFSGWRLGRCISEPALFCRNRVYMSVQELVPRKDLMTF